MRSLMTSGILIAAVFSVFILSGSSAYAADCSGFSSDTCKIIDFEKKGLEGKLRLTIENNLYSLRPIIFLSDDWSNAPIESMAFSLGDLDKVSYEGGFEYSLDGNYMTLRFDPVLSKIGSYDGGLINLDEPVLFSSRRSSVDLNIETGGNGGGGGSSGGGSSRGGSSRDGEDKGTDNLKEETESDVEAQGDGDVPEFSDTGMIISVFIIGISAIFMMRGLGND